MDANLPLRTLRVALSNPNHPFRTWEVVSMRCDASGATGPEISTGEAKGPTNGSKNEIRSKGVGELSLVNG